VPEAAYFIPPLTTIRPDFGAVARESLALLLGQMEPGGQPETGTRRRTIAPTYYQNKECV